MPEITSRSYAGPEDLQAMIDLLLRVRSSEWLSDYPGIVDLNEMLALDSIQANTRLWFNRAGQLAAFALVDVYNNLLFEIEPQADSADLQAEIIDLAAACIRSRSLETGEVLTVDASCREQDVERIAILERHGFSLQSVRTIRLKRSLAEPIPEPTLPASFSIHPSGGAAEAEEWVLLHRAAHGTEYMTVAERLAMIHGAAYDPQLDLVAAAPDGRLAAYCMCQVSQAENRRTGRNEGCTDPIATHPDFQKRGLARALICTGLWLLKDRGMDTAIMGTSSENTAMLSAARSLGFQVETTMLWFSKR